MTHPMVQIYQEQPEKFLALTIWALRKQIKNLLVEITSDDIQKFASLGDYAITIRGKPESMELQLVDKATGKALQASPEGMDDNPEALRMMAFRSAQQRADSVADRLLARDINAVGDAVDILRLMAVTKKVE